MFYLTENCGCHEVMVTDSHRQSQARMDILVYRIVQNTKSQAHQNDQTCSLGLICLGLICLLPQDLFTPKHQVPRHLQMEKTFPINYSLQSKTIATMFYATFFHNLQRNAWKTYQGMAGNFRVPKLQVFRQIDEKFCNCFCQGFQ